MENPGESKTPKLEKRHDLQNPQAFQNEAGVAPGGGAFQNAKKAAPHERVRQKIN